MRFAQRDIQVIEVFRRKPSRGKRLGEEAEYETQGIFTPAVIKPVRSTLTAQLYGERIQKMKQIYTHFPLVEGDKIAIDSKFYKAIASAEYSQHKEYTVEEVEG